MATKPASPFLDGGNSLSTNLLVGLLLQEGTGNPVDLSGNGHNGTLGGGATWTTDAAGNAVACTGGGYISVPLPAISGNFSLLIIHKVTSWPSLSTCLLDDTGRNWSLFVQDFGSIALVSFAGAMVPLNDPQDSGNPSFLPITPGSTLWQLLLVRSGTTLTARVNGSTLGTVTAEATTSAVTTHFGDNPSGAGGNYDGVYDEICLWNRALSGGEITSLTSDPYQMFRGSLVATPVADFTGTPLTGAIPLAVAFTDASTNTPTSWAWTFGDGTTSTSQSPSHTYTQPGVYTVVLTATNASGSDTKTRTAYVNAYQVGSVVHSVGSGRHVGGIMRHRIGRRL